MQLFSAKAAPQIRHATAWPFEALAEYFIWSMSCMQMANIASEINPVISKLLMHATLQCPNSVTWDWKMATLKRKQKHQAAQGKENWIKKKEKCKNLELRRIHTRGDSYYVRLKILTR